MRIPVYYSGAAVLAVYLYFPTIHGGVSSSFEHLVSTQLRIPGFLILSFVYTPTSMMEAVMAGVPMIALPLYAEQFVNRAALVVVEQREGDGFVAGNELERRVRELMGSESGMELRERSARIRGEEALAAWDESGSSTVALDNLVRSWSLENYSI